MAKDQKIRGHEELQNLLQGVEYEDGVMVTKDSSDHETAAG